MTQGTDPAGSAPETPDITHHTYDVLVIGAGGAGLRAAIEARMLGKRVAIISKSLFGKAHTVMAEGGIAASMGNANPNDNWSVHFRDTMRGGKFLNNWRMAELHAKEAPDRVWELEAWGALFDRTKDGKISQRNFGGHEYPRLAHVGDRTGLEMIRTLQQRVVALQQEDAEKHGDPEAMISSRSTDPIRASGQRSRQQVGQITASDCFGRSAKGQPGPSTHDDQGPVERSPPQPCDRLQLPRIAGRNHQQRVVDAQILQPVQPILRLARWAEQRDLRHVADRQAGRRLAEIGKDVGEHCPFATRVAEHLQADR